MFVEEMITRPVEFRFFTAGFKTHVNFPKVFSHKLLDLLIPFNDEPKSRELARAVTNYTALLFGLRK